MFQQLGEVHKLIDLNQVPKRMREDEGGPQSEMERTALKALIDLVEVNQLVNFPKLLEHCVVEECASLFNSNGTYRKTQKSKLVQKFSLQSVMLLSSTWV